MAALNSVDTALPDASLLLWKEDLASPRNLELCFFFSCTKNLRNANLHRSPISRVVIFQASCEVVLPCHDGLNGAAQRRPHREIHSLAQ